MTVIGDRLRSAMKLNRVTLTDVGNVVGMDRTTVSHWINGRHNPKPDQIAKMAKFLAVSSLLC